MSDFIEIKITGLDKVQHNLRAMETEFPKVVNQSMLQTVLYVQGKLPPYPPPPANSTYRRTGTLGRSVTSLKGAHPNALSEVKSLGSEVHGIIGTNLKYAPYVIDQDKQAGVHSGRWWTLQGEFTKLRDSIVGFFQKQIDAFVKKYS